MSKKPSPSRIKFKAERKERRAKDPVVQAKALEWYKLRVSQSNARKN